MNFFKIICMIGLLSTAKCQVDAKSSKAAHSDGQVESYKSKSAKDAGSTLEMSVGSKFLHNSGKARKDMSMSIGANLGSAKSGKETETMHDMSMSTVKSGKPKSSKTMSISYLRSKTHAKMSKSNISMPLN
ncbi:hypothetical protein HJC23_009582 [Cyclotella cryptica]|uniref:Uncharacterized protein n=1 Tax=Cyclotella cryptica TaxID=29204 RepID=A0ABD3PQ06_9STRA|eukprot:CCRYP_012548-RA/>CCRYP_012548-RA protein AED:0.36 eAED:0.36 QI:0/-1/0/1/-1/1/1/0/130